MIRLSFILVLIGGLFILPETASAQEKSTISGYIKDGDSGEELIGATVYVTELATGTVTNVYGFFSLTLPNGSYNLKFSFIGFEDVLRQVELTENTSFDIELPAKSSVLQEVVITGEQADANVKNVEMSVNKMDIATIKKIPALMGEVDVIRSIQLLPGVSTIGEGASGFNVRGGGVDQNLILLDEAPVYNSSHLFGFFSVFNPDAVKNVKLIKGGIPSQYGGRLSSILDVRMKEGNKKKFTGSGGLGLIFSRLTLEGPIKKDKASFIIAARRSYADVLARPFLSSSLSGSKFYFYDLTAKVNYKLNDKNRFFLSSYLGKDVFGTEDFQFDWGNQTATARWNHIFNDKVFMNMSAIYSKYDYSIGVGDGDDGFNWQSNIINYSLKPEFTYYVSPKNTLTFGLQTIIFDFKPGSASFNSGGEGNDISLQDQKAAESAIYVANEQKIGARVALQYGLRWSAYQYFGDGNAYTLNDTTPGLERSIVATEAYDQWETIASYNNFEPRLSIKYDLTETSSLKASYNRMSQYLHLLSNTAASTPLDVWSPTTNNVKPQLADQWALGYFHNFKQSMFETSVEVYYKDMQNQVEYINNADLLLNEFYETQLLVGDGRAYGMEFYIKKAKGDFTGWISYTLSRTERQVGGLNLGKWFPTKFDRTHNLSVVASQQINERWSISANFVYSTGTPSTFPTNRFYVQGWVAPHNSEERRNNYRVPDFHRLDLSATLASKKKENRKWEGEWVFSVYNAYARRNAFSVYFQEDPNVTLGTEAVRYSIVGSFIPSIAYNFKF